MESLLSALRAAAEPTRLRLLGLLADGDLTVSELTQILGQSQPRVSRHLKLMCEAGLLDRFPEGAWVFYRLARFGAGADLARLLLGRLPADDATVNLDRQRLSTIRAARAARAQAYFTENAARWDEIRRLHVDDALVEQALRDLVPDCPMGELVDLGTGTGRILEVLGSRFQRATGFDLSREMLALARANLDRAGLTQCMVRQGDVTQLPLPGGSVDVATIFQVLHYADDPAPVIGEAARILKPGGLLVIADFAPHGLEVLRDHHAHRRLGFTDPEMHGWLAQAGLVPGLPMKLPGSPLNVVLWQGRKEERIEP